MSHLGERVTALVDGQLPTEAAQRAARHLDDCPQCRQAVELERLMKYRLIGMGRPEPGGDLVGQLLALGGPSGPLPPRNGHVPGSPRPALISIGLTTGLITGTPPPTRRDSALRSISLPRALPRPALIPSARVVRTSRNRMAAAVVGAACLVGAGVAGGVASGGVAAGGPVTRTGVTNQRTGRTAIDTFSVGREDTAEQRFLDQSVLWDRAGVPALLAQAHR